VEAAQLRSTFLDYFADNGHTVVPSASLIPYDPSLLFTVAGMVPFKPYFTEEEPAPYPRAVSVQKLLSRPRHRHHRHDPAPPDLLRDDGQLLLRRLLQRGRHPLRVGPDHRGFRPGPERLWVTVHTSDDQAEELWRDLIGVPASRIQRLGEDNFWEMGPTGPCGPSSEIFFDKGARFGADGGPESGGEDRFVEFWNLVFTQYDRGADGTLSELPKKNIDTGAGFERVLAILNGLESVFATDLFAPLLETASRAIDKRYGDDETTDVAIRRIAEHGRAMTMLVADGVLPSNEDGATCCVASSAAPYSPRGVRVRSER